MKSLSDYLTPTALARWVEIKSNPQHQGFTTKQLLSNIISRTPAEFLLDLSLAQAAQTKGKPAAASATGAGTNIDVSTKSDNNRPSMDELLAEFGND